VTAAKVSKVTRPAAATSGGARRPVVSSNSLEMAVAVDSSDLGSLLDSDAVSGTGTVADHLPPSGVGGAAGGVGTFDKFLGICKLLILGSLKRHICHPCILRLWSFRIDYHVLPI
jgi:hypothetical protein